MDLRVCVPLGALFEDSLASLEAVGLPIAPLRDAGRRLNVEVPDGPTYITTRPSDVPTYVESGAADLGIVGRDVLLERQPDVYELADLGFGGCRMSWCTPDGDDRTSDAMDRFGSMAAISIMSNPRLEDCAAATKGSKIFQLACTKLPTTHQP